MNYAIEPIGHVRGGRTASRTMTGGEVTATIELADGFDAEALAGLGDFSHAEIVFLFDRVPEGKSSGAPVGRAAATIGPLVGIFAQRGKNDPIAWG